MLHPLRRGACVEVFRSLEVRHVGAVMFAHEESRKVIGAIIDLAEQAANDPWDMDTSDDTSAIKEKLRGIVGDDIAAAYKMTDKSARSDALNAASAKGFSQMIKAPACSRATSTASSIRLRRLLALRVSIMAASALALASVA